MARSTDTPWIGPVADSARWRDRADGGADAAARRRPLAVAGRARGTRERPADPVDRGRDPARGARRRERRRAARGDLALGRPTAAAASRSTRRRRAALRVGAELAARARRAPQRARRAPRPRFDQRGPPRRARRRPPLHRPRLPARACSRPAASRRATTRRCRGCSPRAAGRPGLETDGAGREFDLGGDAVASRSRAAAGPAAPAPLLRPDPRGAAAPLLRLTGLPGAAARVGLRALEEPRRLRAPATTSSTTGGLPRNDLPLDAIVIDSPWETQYNTWEFNPHQFPDAAGLVARMREDGVRTVVWVTPWVNLESADGQRPPDPISERLHREPAPNYDEGAGAGHFVRDADGEPYVGALVDGHRLAGRLHLPRGRRWWSDQARPRVELGVEGIKADDGEGYYFPPDVALRRRPHRRRGGVGATGASTAERCRRRSTRSTPGRGVALRAQRLDRPAVDRGALGRRPGVGLLVAADAASPRRSPPRRAASPTGRTTSAATSASGWWSAAARSCCCAGRSSAASRR